MGSRKILIVDDNEDFAQVLSTHLSKMGYQTTIAKDGVEATNKVAIDPPDIILLDFVMPAADGETVHRRLQFSTETHATPVIFVSGVPEVEKYVEKKPNTRFLPKPVDMKRLVATIRELLPDGDAA